MNSLYINYWSLMEPLCQSQSLPYLRRLARHGIHFDLITYERPEYRIPAGEVKSVVEELREEGIAWHPLPYHKHPTVAATTYDLLRGALLGVKLVRQKKISVVHSRGTTSSAAAWGIARLTKARFLYDADGPLWQEYVDAGVWKSSGLAYRSAKWMGDLCLRDADAVVVLTERRREQMRAELNGTPKQVEVIPCCVDLRAYAPCTEHGAQNKGLTVVYAGTTGGFYLPQEMVRFFAELLRLEPAAFFRFLTRSSPEPLRSLFSGEGVPADRFSITAARPEEVPQLYALADVGISFRQPVPSQAAASPIKIAEYLAAGLPVVSNTGIGDMQEILEENRVGVVVNDFSSEACRKAAMELLSLAKEPDVRERCHATAQRFFDIDRVAVPRYLCLYSSLLRK